MALDGPIPFVPRSRSDIADAGLRAILSEVAMTHYVKAALVVVVVVALIAYIPTTRAMILKLPAA